MKSYKVVGLIKERNTLELLDESTGVIYQHKLKLPESYSQFSIGDLYLAEIFKAA